MFIECVLLASSLCHAVKDKPVVALTAMHAASVIADGITTKQFERRGHYEVVSTWILGREPDTPRLAAVWSAEVLIEAIAADRMHRSRTWIRHVWWLPQTISIVAHASNTLRNSQLRP
jgi:hypothetical protein